MTLNQWLKGGDLANDPVKCAADLAPITDVDLNQSEPGHEGFWHCDVLDDGTAVVWSFD